MSTLLVALLGVMLVPLFLGNWRASLFGLACQGLLMGWLELEARPVLDAADWLMLVELLVVRGLLAPWLLFDVLRAREAEGRNDVIPPNLLSWTGAIALVFLAFSLAPLLVPADDLERQRVGVAAAGLLLGLFVLSTQSGVFSQMVGALRFENAIALFELGAPREHASVGLRAALTVVFVATVAAFRWYLEREVDPHPPADRPEEPTL